MTAFIRGAAHLAPGRFSPSDIGILLEAWRQAAAGNASARRLCEFGTRCGPRSDATIEAYFTFLRVLGRSSRRTLAVGHPGCPGMTQDEVQVLSLLGGAQSGDWTLLDAHLCWIAPKGPRAVVAAAAMVLAEALTKSGVAIAAGLRTEPPRGDITWGPGLMRAHAQSNIA